MSAWDYQVRQTRPSEVQEDLVRVWRDNLPVEDASRKYAWFYQEAPICPKAVFVLSASQDDAPEKIVGSAGIGIREFSVRGKMVRSALLADLAVDENHRQLLPALRLVRAAHEYCTEHHPMLYGFPNKQAVGVFRRAGYKQLGLMPRYARVLRHAGYLNRLSKHEKVPKWAGKLASTPIARSILGAAADAVQIARLVPELAQVVHDYQLVWLESPDTRIDELWDACKEHYTIVAHRSSAFLRWRFPRAAHHRIAALVPRGGGGIRAYAVVQRDGDLVHIRDFFGFPDALQPLLERLVPALYWQGASSISVRYLGAARGVAALRACGFREREGVRAIIIDSAPELDIDEVESWHLCDADEDA